MTDKKQATHSLQEDATGGASQAQGPRERDPSPLFPTAAGAALISAASFGCGSKDSKSSSHQGPDDQGVPAEGYVRLAFNESPFGPSQAAHAAMDEMLSRPYAIDSPDTHFLPGINRYPDFLNVELIDLFARRHGISSRFVFPTCGISEICYMCSQAFIGPQKRLLMPEVTFDLQAHYAEKMGCEVRRVPMTSQHAVDLDGLLNQVDTDTGLVYIANPNNPTGSLIPFEDLKAFVREVHRRSEDTVVFIDEAYMEYVQEDPLPEAVPLVRSFPVLVGRTLSKAFGLAGLRVGYVVGHEDLILLLNGFLGGYLGGDMGWRMFEGNVNRMATAASQGSLTSKGLAHIDSVREQNAALREHLAQELDRLGYMPLPSHTNFLLVSVGSDGENLRRHLCARKVLVQAGGSFHPDYRNWVRVSVGDQDEVDALLAALKGYDPSVTYPSCFPVYYHGI